MVDDGDDTRGPQLDEAKVRAVVALCDELRLLSPDDPQYGKVLRRVDQHWRKLTTAEQDEVDRIFGQRGLVRAK